MRGKITIGEVEAIMDDAGIWTCSDKMIEERLNAKYRSSQHGPASMPAGYVAIDVAAHDFGGVAFHPNPLGPLPEGVIS